MVLTRPCLAALLAFLPCVPAKEVLGKLEASRNAAPEVLKQAAASGFDEVRLKLDEIWFHAMGKEGPIQTGGVRAKLAITEAGKVSFRVSRFEVRKQ